MTEIIAYKSIDNRLFETKEDAEYNDKKFLIKKFLDECVSHTGRFNEDDLSYLTMILADNFDRLSSEIKKGEEK